MSSSKTEPGLLQTFCGVFAVGVIESLDAADGGGESGAVFDES